MAVKWVSAALFGLGLTAAGGAQALPSQLVSGEGTVCFGDCVAGGNNLFEFSILIDPRTGNIFTDGTNEFQYEGDTVVIGMAGNADPIMIASVTVLDFGAATTFGFTFTSPFAPTAPAGAMLNSMATLTGTLFDARDMGDGDVSATALLASSSIMQTLVQGLPVTAVGPAASSNVGIGGSLVYGPHSASMAFTCPATGCDNFGIQLDFTGAGGGDEYQFTATHELTPAQGVPAPMPLILISLGLLGLGGARRLGPA